MDPHKRFQFVLQNVPKNHTVLCRSFTSRTAPVHEVCLLPRTQQQLEMSSKFWSSSLTPISRFPTRGRGACQENRNPWFCFAEKPQPRCVFQLAKSCLSHNSALSFRDTGRRQRPRSELPQTFPHGVSPTQGNTPHASAPPQNNFCQHQSALPRCSQVTFPLTAEDCKGGGENAGTG